MHFLFPWVSTYLIIILTACSSILNPVVNMDLYLYVGQFLPKCGPHLIYIQTTASSEQFCFRGIRVSKVVVAFGNIHFNFGASDLNIRQS